MAEQLVSQGQQTKRALDCDADNVDQRYVRTFIYEVVGLEPFVMIPHHRGTLTLHKPCRSWVVGEGLLNCDELGLRY